MTLKELRARRANLVEQARAVLTTAETEKRSLSSDEQGKWDSIMADVDALKATIEANERIEDEERSLEASTGRTVLNGTTAHRSIDVVQADALRAWFLSGSDAVPTPAQVEAANKLGLNLHNRNLNFTLNSSPLRAGQDPYEWAQRAQSAGVDAAGGYTVAPEFQRELEKALLDFGGVRQAARILRTATGAKLPWPTVSDVDNEGAQINENVADSELDVAFGTAEMDAFGYTSRIVRVSKELLQDSAFNIGAEIGGMLGERIARRTARAFTTGTGTAEPQGVATAASVGYTNPAALGSAPTYDDLVEVEHSLPSAYRRRGAVWMFNDSVLKALKKIKDANGLPIWVPGLATNAPDTILGYPYIINDDMAGLSVANGKSILFGDFSKFVVRDVLDVSVQRLDERYAEFRQVAFVAFSRHDSRLIAATGSTPIRAMANAAV